MNTVMEFFLLPLSPVLAVIAAALLLIVAECFPSLSLKPLKLGLAILGPIASMAYTVQLWRAWPIAMATEGTREGPVWLLEFLRTYHLDTTTLIFYGGIALFTLLSIVMLNAAFRDEKDKPEVFILTLFVASGMMLLVSANSLLMVFLALELLSLPTYVLVGIRRRDRRACEAALKYFLFGSFATVLLVFGIALLYAQYGSLQIPRIAELVSAQTTSLPIPRVFVLSAIALITAAVGFKVGVVPFHMWVPDVYEGAPAALTGFMGSAVKLAGFGLAMRVFWGMFLPIAEQWSGALGILAVVTMFVGNLAALVQDNLKRMFAYSSISHAGYLLLGLSALPKAGPNPSLMTYYLMVYGLMFIGLFAVLHLIEDETQDTDIYQLSGLGFTHPVLGFCLALFALSAAGIPPTSGFLAKYFIFLEAVRAGKTPLVVLAVISSLIGVYYYLRVLVYLFMRESKENLQLSRRNRVALVCIVFCACSVLYFTIAPGLLGMGSTLP